MASSALLLLILVAADATAFRPESNPPRGVVLIIGDDQAWTDFGFMGHPDIETPHLDRLAAEGTLFRRGYAPSSLCRPSLLSIATGLYPHEHGVTGNDPRDGVDRARMLARIDDVITLPRLLAEHGFRSLQTGKWWEGSARRGGFTEGMTHGNPARGGRHGDAGLTIGRQGLEPIASFVDRCLADDALFFVWYAPFLPHRPHNPPQELLARYQAPGRPASIARYMAMCAWLDRSCGELMELLEERGVADETLIAFVVDNGWIQRPDAAGYAPRSKRSPYEGGVRTPIVLRWPSRVPTGTIDAPVSSVDLAPTIARACGVEPSTQMSGNDLIATANGAPPRRAEVHGALFEHDVVDLDHPTRSLTHRYVIDGRWKLIAPADRSAAPELFDLLADPQELEDRAAAEPSVVANLTAKVDAWWTPAPPKRPSFLFVVTDDQRADALGAAGHPFLRTPTMDRLAAEGVRFSNAFVTTSICAASRASLLTGLAESGHRFTFRTPPLSRALCEASYPAHLRAAGYRTGFVGKWGVKVESDTIAAMWDRFDPRGQPYLRADGESSGRHLTDRIGDAAIEFLQDTPADSPFCLTVCFHAPHAEDSNPDQYVWPRRLDGLYDDQPIPPPPLSDPAFFAGLPEFQRDSMNRDRWRWRFDDEEKRIRMTRGYLRMITGVDEVLARIVDSLGDRAGETVVIFTSDNGYFLGDRGFAGKWTIHEPSIRVPLIVLDPRIPADRRGRVASEMALNVDLPATVLDLAGLPVPPSMLGRSLAPLLRGEAPDEPWREEFYYEHRFDHRRIPKSEGVRGERYVYARYFEQSPPFEELYDLATDPWQANNLARDPELAERLAEMRRRCDELARAARGGGS